MSEKRYQIKYSEGDAYYIEDTQTGKQIGNLMPLPYGEKIVDIANQQADELDTLRTQNRELREALEPFARKHIYDSDGDFMGYYLVEDMFSPEEFKAARKALEGAK